MIIRIAAGNTMMCRLISDRIAVKERDQDPNRKLQLVADLLSVRWEEMERRLLYPPGRGIRRFRTEVGQPQLKPQ